MCYDDYPSPYLHVKMRKDKGMSTEFVTFWFKDAKEGESYNANSLCVKNFDAIESNYCYIIRVIRNSTIGIEVLYCTTTKKMIDEDFLDDWDRNGAG